LVIHIIHQLCVGGLENGLVNLINRMPTTRYRHAIVCMTDFSDFKERIRRQEVQVFAMHRGLTPLARTYWELYRLFRTLKPSIVHSRNLSGLDALLPAACAGVAVRIHGEHGRDMDDLDGTNPKHRRLKRLFRPLVTQYTTVSRDLADYLVDDIGVPAERVRQIYNGVDTEHFYPRKRVASNQRRGLIVGTVGRLQAVKDQVSLVKGFAAAVQQAPGDMRDARLVIVGDGPFRSVIDNAIAETSLQSRVELLGRRNDIPDILRSLDIFVLPSLAEGISNTVLEAMATGLPVVATRVGGNADLVADGVTGALVDAGDWRAIAEHIAGYARDSDRLARQGRAARARAEKEFSLDAMVENYGALYDAFVGTDKSAEAAGSTRAAF
jgi:sugar transferase (PEP-CTERM/EpsH1 system associated)